MALPSPKDFGPYEEAYNALLEKVRDKSPPVLTYENAKKILIETPGQFYSEGTTWDQILERMSCWGYIALLEVKGLEKFVILLDINPKPTK